MSVWIKKTKSKNSWIVTIATPCVKKITCQFGIVSGTETSRLKSKRFTPSCHQKRFALSSFSQVRMVRMKWIRWTGECIKLEL